MDLDLKSGSRSTTFIENEENNSLDQVVLEPIAPDTYHLSYTCLMIPRFPAHELRGDIAEYLPQWLQQVCISYGWRLGFIDVYPEYLHWAISVSPSTAPNRFMQQIRLKTSEIIFSNFGRLRKENLSNDFWAPGYLVVLGVHPQPKEMIEQYIRLTRKHQGLHSF